MYFSIGDLSERRGYDFQQVRSIAKVTVSDWNYYISRSVSHVKLSLFAKSSLHCWKLLALNGTLTVIISDSYGRSVGFIPDGSSVFM